MGDHRLAGNFIDQHIVDVPSVMNHRIIRLQTEANQNRGFSGEGGEVDLFGFPGQLIACEKSHLYPAAAAIRGDLHGGGIIDRLNRVMMGKEQGRVCRRRKVQRRGKSQCRITVIGVVIRHTVRRGFIRIDSPASGRCPLA